MYRRMTMHKLWCAMFVAAICGIMLNQALAGPVADIMVVNDVFTIGDDIDVWVTAVNPTHEFEIDVYLMATTDGSTAYLTPSGWGSEQKPFIAGYMMPQLTEPVTLRLASVTAGQIPAFAGKKCRLKLWVTPSNVPEMVYCEDEVTFSVAPEGFVAIPSGRFMMGTGHTPCPFLDQVPHKVCLTSFFAAETETTVADFAAFLNEAGATVADCDVVGPDGGRWAYRGSLAVDFNDGVFTPKAGYEDYPATVRYVGAAAYVASMGAKLPTEAQWEYAARAFAPGDYPWGNEESCDWGNIWVDGDACNSWLLPVRSFPPNGFGLYEVCGNATEICSDWFDRDEHNGLPWGESYYQWCYENYPDGIVNPQGPPGPPPGIEPTYYAPWRVTRGGPPTSPYMCMLWARATMIGPDFNSFRVVLEPPR